MAGQSGLEFTGWKKNVSEGKCFLQEDEPQMWGETPNRKLERVGPDDWGFVPARKVMKRDAKEREGKQQIPN